MTRVGIYFRVKEGRSEAYAKAHANIWPGMREVLNEAGICNYSIWNLGEMLFAYYEVEDMKHMNQVLASSEIYKKWIYSFKSRQAAGTIISWASFRAKIRLVSGCAIS